MMLTRSALALITATLVGAAVPGSSFASTTLKWVERATNEHEVDIAPAGDSFGDLLVFVNPMFDAANAKQVGESNGSCVRTDPGKSWHCAWTMTLAKGQLEISGVYPDKGDMEFAITGGSGEYAGARGTLKVHARDASHSSYDFTATLL